MIEIKINTSIKFQRPFTTIKFQILLLIGAILKNKGYYHKK